MSVLTPTEIGAAALRAGFPASELVTAVAVAYAESNGDPSATNHNTNGSTDYGLWQINSVHGDLLRTGNWQNPDDNARMAYSVWKAAGNSWRPWSTFNSGAYRPYLNRYNSPQDATVSAQPVSNTNAGISIPGLPDLSAISNVFGHLGDSALWKRVGLALLGIALVIVGLVAVFRKQIVSVAKTGAKAAAVAA